MSNTKFRPLSIILGIAVLAGAFAVSKYFQAAAEAPKKVKMATPPPKVQTISVQNTSINSELEVQGELKAFNKIDIFSEVSGTLNSTAKPFKVGSYFPKGATLISVDDTEARLNLLAQKSTLLNAITQLMPDLKIDYPESFQQWKTYLDNYNVEQAIQAFPEALNEQEKYFIASRNLLSQYYNIKSAEERLSKYIVKAPFSGVITQTSINPGALVRSGQKLGELMNNANYELEVTIPLSELKYIRNGSKVQLQSRDLEGSWTGTIRRINDQVDAGTQTVTVFVGVNGKNLREGMYMLGSLNARPIENAFSLPRNLLVNQNAVYAVHQDELELKEVEVIRITESAAIIRGLENGTQLLSNTLPGAFAGMKVSTSEGSVSNSPTNASNAAVGGR